TPYGDSLHRWQTRDERLILIVTVESVDNAGELAAFRNCRRAVVSGREGVIRVVRERRRITMTLAIDPTARHLPRTVPAADDRKLYVIARVILEGRCACGILNRDACQSVGTLDDRRRVGYAQRAVVIGQSSTGCLDRGLMAKRIA